MIKEAKHLKSPTEFDINFWFKTFDENALLFLSPHEQGSYLALTLHDGYMQYEVHYNKDEITPLIMKTHKKYNDGKKHNVVVAKLFTQTTMSETSKLTVDSDVQHMTVKITKSQLLKIKRTNFYIGGVSPDYAINSNNITDTLHTHQSFLGDIENFMILNQLIMLHETSRSQHQYGVQLTDKPVST